MADRRENSTAVGSRPKDVSQNISSRIGGGNRLLWMQSSVVTDEQLAKKARKVDNAKNIQMDGREELDFNLKDLVNKPESSDLVFRCNDGILVHACRWLLANRCTVFKSMLSNGMLETRLSKIQLSFSSPVILSVMEYLYSGTIESYPPPNWKMGFELISAARFFVIRQVEIIAQDFLRMQALGFYRIQMSVLLDMFNVAVEFRESWEGRDETLLELVHNIGFRNLSRESVEYILSTCIHRGHGGQQGGNNRCLEEYYTFRTIVLWHVHQVLPTCNAETRKALQNALPGKALTLWQRSMSPIDHDINDYISGVSFSVDSSVSTTVLNSLVGTNINKDSLQNMLRHIDLSCIPASLLLKVINPLKICPPRQLAEALLQPALRALLQRAEQRALETDVPCSMSRSDWKHGPSLRTYGDTQIVCGNKTGDGYAEGMAVACIPMPMVDDYYKWRFEILEADALRIELGFIRKAASHISEEDKMLAKSLQASSKTSSRFVCISREGNITLNGNEPDFDVDILDDQWLDGTEVMVNKDVIFTLMMLDRDCQVMLNNRTIEEFFRHLPDGEYYPAVGFYRCKYARVQLTLESGFEYF